MSWFEPTLFDPAPGIVGADHPDTSRDAALRVMPRTGTQRRRVLDFIRRCGDHGATDLELQHALELAGNSERPRRIELVAADLIVDSGRRRRGHIVWISAGSAAEELTTHTAAEPACGTYPEEQ